MGRQRTTKREKPSKRVSARGAGAARITGVRTASRRHTPGGWASTGESRFRSWLKSDRPVVRFVVGFCLLIGMFYAGYIPLSQSEIYGSYLRGLARASAAVLRIVGEDARAAGQTVVSPGFSTKIVSGCDGMEALALFVAAVLASPVSLRSRVAFAIVGALVLLAANLARIVILFLIGVHFPTAFETVHLDAWPAVFIVLVLFCWLTWAVWVARREGVLGIHASR